jgi:hypothetical protein
VNQGQVLSQSEQKGKTAIFNEGKDQIMNDKSCGHCQHFSRADVSVWNFPQKGICTARIESIKGVLRMRQDQPLTLSCFHAKPADLREGKLYNE